MDLDELARSLAQGRPKPVYILQGSEQLMLDEAEALILKHAVDDPQDAMSVSRLDMADAKVGAREVVAACRAIGLFVSRIAVVARAVDVVDKKTSERDELTRYVSAPVGACTLILKATKLDGKSALVKRAKKTGAILKFDELKTYQAVGWVSERIRALGHRADRQTAELIVELVGPNLLRLRNTLEQLSLYAGANQAITPQAVEVCLSATRSHDVFELVDAVAEQRAGAALRHLQAMLGQREAPLKILAMLSRHFRTLWQLKALRERGASLDQATQEVGVHPFTAKKTWPQTQKFHDRTLRAVFERLYETDLALKSSPIQNALLMERLVLDLCAA
ncbi:MAG: DNA polymerase III subunit delta [Deltaproteobacteria bacterium]|nr:MAG: DNA polymerase III subunit delta [Deltaproteobacteria bacterium]